MNEPRAEADAIADIARQVRATTIALPDLVEDGGDHAGVTVIAVPKGMEVKSIKPLLDEYRTRPERRKGTAELLDLGSFIAHANRFKDAHSAVFADSTRTAPSLTSVLDYHEDGSGPPRFGTHRGVYRFPLSEDWLKWTSLAGKWIDQAAFAELLDERITDVIDPSQADVRSLDVSATIGRFALPSTLMETSRSLRINAHRSVRQAVNTSSGETQVSFVEEHRGDGGGLVDVPRAFLIGIPVFRGGDRYQVPVRLRYRLVDQKAMWCVDPYRTDTVIDFVLEEAFDEVKSKTDLPLFLGRPEQ